MRLVKHEVLDWAAKNEKIKTLKIPYTGVRAGDPKTAWYPQFIVDKQSILKGEKSKN